MNSGRSSIKDVIAQMAYLLINALLVVDYE